MVDFTPIISFGEIMVVNLCIVTVLLTIIQQMLHRDYAAVFQIVNNKISH